MSSKSNIDRTRTNDELPPKLAPLLLTAGEPAGIGPDLCLMLAGASALENVVVVADPSVLEERARQLRSDVRIVCVSEDELGQRQAGGKEILVLPEPYAVPVVCGKPDPAHADVLLRGIARAVHLCCTGKGSGLVTAPVAKNVINDAGIAFTGHTEYLAELTQSPLPVMLLVANTLRVALASTHLPLRDVADYLTTERLTNVIRVLDEGLRTRFGIHKPAILVCGLNPHAGDGGYLGREEQTIIGPVIEALAADGVNVRGPISADTAFLPVAGHNDAVLAMFHDQGLPVLKYAGFGDAVNVTLGLPIVRTSVDHGTAFSLAGTGKADAGSLAAAVTLARQLVANT